MVYNLMVNLNNFGLVHKFFYFDNLENVKHNKSEIEAEVSLQDAVLREQGEGGVLADPQNLPELVVQHERDQR